jgi:hypothetical protein
MLWDERTDIEYGQVRKNREFLKLFFSKKGDLKKLSIE